MNLPMQSPFTGVPANSPWAHLAATSGIPTPSLDGPGGPIHSPFGPGPGAGAVFGGQGRSISPHLGAPFELLNLGGSGSNPPGVGAGTSKSPPMGWPGAFSGNNMTAQTPGLGSSNMADPFSSLPAPGSSSVRAVGGREAGSGLESLAAKLAKRRGSKSGPSALSQSVLPSTDEPMERGGEKAAIGRKENPNMPGQNAVTGGSGSWGPVSGPGRSNLNLPGGAPMKLNLPSGLAGRLGSAPTPNSTSSTPGTSLSKPAATAGGKGSTTMPQALLPVQLASMLGQPEGQVLILDIRPPSSYVQSHLPGALSLPVPSTLLKRPAFTVEKLAQMLSARAASAIVDFKTAQEIVIVDQDSPIAAPGSVIVGLASKFGNAMTEAESRVKQGHVHFVKGGMAACSDLEGVTLETGQEESSEDETDAQVAGLNGPGSPTEQPGRMIGRLDRMAFSSGEKMYSTVLWLTPADAVCTLSLPYQLPRLGLALDGLTLPNR
jgi:rhodanese-related sulfurtransferase